MAKMHGRYYCCNSVVIMPPFTSDDFVIVFTAFLGDFAISRSPP
jgi:hypothetical protein